MYTNASELISWHKTLQESSGLHKSLPTLVHVHIATEDLETLHPGATGPCFIIKVWLVTLIGLTSSLSNVRGPNLGWVLIQDTPTVFSRGLAVVVERCLVQV